MSKPITSILAMAAVAFAVSSLHAETNFSLNSISIRPASTAPSVESTTVSGPTSLGRSFRYAGPVVTGIPAQEAAPVTRLEMSPGVNAPPAPPAQVRRAPVRIVNTPGATQTVAGPTISNRGTAPAGQRPRTMPIHSASSSSVKTNTVSAPSSFSVRPVSNPVRFDPAMLGQAASAAAAAHNEKAFSSSTTEGKYWTDAGDCGSCGSSCCCRPCWHRSGAFFDFLYLHASGVDVAYAIPQDGINTGMPATGTAPMGAVGVADPDYEGGARIGFNYALDCCSSLTATYTWYESDTAHGFSATAPIVARSLLHVPSVVTTTEGYGNAATARYDIDFDLFDLDYRRLYSAGRCHSVNYLVGVRYGYLNQELVADIASTTTSRISTDVDFEGLGLRFGVDGERHAACSGMFVYGRAIANILAGEVRADYLLANTAPATLANISWEDDRVVPVLEYEVGAGWQNECGTLRLSVGYYMAAWFNTVSTGTWVQAVQGANFVNVDDTMTFDGLTARAEVRW